MNDQPTLPFDLNQLTVIIMAAGLIAALLVVVFIVLLVFVLVRLLRRRQPPREQPRFQPWIDVGTWEPKPPPPGGMRLELYGTPVRLAVAVIAPVGREGTIPPDDQLPELFQQLIPEFDRVVASHQPVVKFWPSQLSSQGFTHAFASQVVLPGDHGKGTPWCSITGKFTAHGEQYLAGLVCCGEKAAALGHITVEHEGQWNDILRIRA